MNIRSFALLCLLCLFSSNSTSAFAAGDLNFQLSSGIAPYTNVNWIGGGSLPAYASSSDGTKIFASVGALYKSVDSGANFTAVTIESAADTADFPFTAVWSSPDGTKLAAVQYKGDLYTSVDSGVTWVSYGLSLASRSVSLSIDLNHIYIGTDKHWISGNWSAGGTVWVSDDSGASFADASVGAVISSSNYLAIKSTLNGEKVWAVGQDHLYQSSDYGTSWTENSNFGSSADPNWGSCCWRADSSDDLQIMLIGSNGNGFYLSRNGGQTFIQIPESSIPENWRDGGPTWGYGVGVSRNGDYLVGVDVGDYVYVSSDGGLSWSQQLSLGQDTWAGQVSVSNSGDIVVGGDAGISWWDIHSGKTYFYKAIPVVRSEVSQSAEEVAAKRAADKRIARAEISNKLATREKITVETFSKADIDGITTANLAEVEKEILALPVESRSDIAQILKIARKFEVVDQIASDRVASINSGKLIEIGLIPMDSKFKSSLTVAVKKLPASERSSYADIKVAIEREMAVIQTRKDRLAKLMSRKSSFR